MTPPWIERQRQRLAEQPGHALLLHGPSGLGQYELALGLARTWLCEALQPDGPCGHCPGCHAIEVRAHADLMVLMPETAMLELGWPLPEKAQQELDEKKRKPSREIRVEAMRDMVEFAQRTSGRGQGKVVLVHPADRMNAITANTLLKTLEEPAGEVRFILSSEAAHLLLPTIRSRCLGHALDWPSPAEALAWLEQQGVPGPDAAVLLRAAGGRPEDALRASREGLGAQQWARLPRAVARGDVAALASLPPAQAVQALQKLCHDLLVVQVGGSARFFDPQDLPKAASIPRLTEWWRELGTQMRSAEHPFNAGLMLEALVSRARAALN